MMLTKTILGAMAVMTLASFALANPLVQRPLSRSDAAVSQHQVEHANLAAFRPIARPPHMLRHPVAIESHEPAVRPIARSSFLPRTRWDFKDNGHVWTRAAMSAVMAHGTLAKIIPRDIDTWCPGYAQNSLELRTAFWVGMMSALSKHESTYNPRAVGGGDLWYGLLQIYPDTARRYGCRARTGEGLKNATDNLSCAARIMAVTVARDRAVALHDGRWRGVAADWGPMTNRSKIAEMAHWTSTQSYCVPIENMRPQARPNRVGYVSTMGAVPLAD